MPNLMEATIQQREAPEAVSSSDQDHSISFVQEIPTYLKEAIASFIEEHPNWDQYRLIQAAIAGYLLQKGVDTREINRIYSQSMFCKKAFGQSQ